MPLRPVLLVLATALAGLAPLSTLAATAAPASGTDPAAMRATVDGLLTRMTLMEKVGQLTILGADHKDLAALIRKGEVGGTNGVLPGVDVAAYTRRMQHLALQSRLHIPLLFMGDVVHGFRTIFPMPIGLAATWDPALVQQAMHAAAQEATRAGVDWTFAPMVDIGRDPRWGRVSEGAGEDPYLDAVMTGAAIRGFQGKNLAASDAMLATAKHFAGYGAVQAGRDYNSVWLPRYLLDSVYLPPFKAAVDQGVGAVMAAFIALNAVPTTADGALIHGVLRRQWGFDGLVVSDYDAVPQLQQHGIAATPAQAAQEAIDAGIDIDLHSGTYLKELPMLVREGKVPMATVDAAVRRVLEAKYRLGLFADPYRHGGRSGDSPMAPPSAAHRALAREVAARSMVLLRNQNHTLPLRSDLQRIAVIGPLADDRLDLLGPVHAEGQADEAVSVLAGIRQAVSPHTQVLYAPGTRVRGHSEAGFAQAVALARSADVAVLVVGEDVAIVGEGNSRSHLGLPGNQLALVKAVVATGTPVVVVLINGRALALPWLARHVPAILDAWMPGTEGGPAVADVLFGRVDPSGKLPVTFPRDLGQVPLYYSQLRTGRPYNPDDPYTTRYVDVANTPLFPFGYGLSYTTFAIGDVHADRARMPWNGTLTVSASIRNTGTRRGTDVVQLYVHDEVASVSPPLRLLRGFRRVTLAPGEQRTLHFRLTRRDLAIVQSDLRWQANPGNYRIYVGDSSTATDHVDVVLEAPATP